MNNFVKSGIVATLAISIFGGGGFLTYDLFLKKPDTRRSAGNQPVITPTPDQGIPMLQEAKQQLAKGEKVDAEKLLAALIQTFPKSMKVEDARKMLGEMQVEDFFSPQPGPDKSEYIVVRGDSIARIANKTKTPAELIFKANGLDSLVIQPGTKLVIPKGDFSLVINRKTQDVTLLNKGAFFKCYKPVEFKLSPKTAPGQFKVREKIAWHAGARVAFGGKNYLGSSRWIVISVSNITLFSEANTQNPNVQKPNTGIMLTPPDMEELFALVSKDTVATIQ